MITHKQRIFTATRGELPDMLPYVPRIDLWHNANSRAGTIPEKHKGRTHDEIARAEGWAIHKIVPEYGKVRKPEDTLHWAIGVLSLKETVFKYRFPPDIEIKVKHQGDRTRVEYHTPIGMVSTTTIYTEEMRKAGASTKWIGEHIIKKPEDYRVTGYIFENLELMPAFDDFITLQNEVGEDGIVATQAGRAASPMHHIQKYFLDETDFYYHYHDYPKEMRALAESVGSFFSKVLEVIADSPAEAVLWGMSFDETITYPSYFEKEIVPWIRKASDILGGKVLIGHCDGENLGLMDLIRDSGMHVAEALTPYPMTKARIEEYYLRWSDKVTIFGGIPESLLLEETATDEDLEAYLDHLFKVVAPGKRLILGIGDSTPPKAVFNRLVRIGERVEKEGRLPLEGGGARPLTEHELTTAAARVTPQVVDSETFQAIQEDVFKGDHTEIKQHVREMLDKGVNAQDILQRGMTAAMAVVGEKFKTGEVYIPEVLLSARAMNEALSVLEPYLSGKEKEVSGKVLMGTVRGDMHDIGKNIVSIMLRGVGFEVRDMGVNVQTGEILRQVDEYKPDTLGLSALLTTTMPEMRKAIDALKAKKVRSKVKVIVGGAPVNEKFAKDIGADGYAPDAGEAVTLVKKLMKK